MSVQMPSSSPFSFNNIRVKFWKKRSLTISDYDPTFKVIYLGNVLTPWAKGDGCVEKPLATLWKNYCANVKHEIYMKLTICNSGIKALTREHGLTEYWANRVTFCFAHPSYPKVFCWIYRHEGRKMKQELRCHAVLCTKDSKPKEMAEVLNQRLISALAEFRREKRMRQNTRMSLANTCQELRTKIPTRKMHLVKGQANFRAPLERSKSAPKLNSIDEDEEEDEEEEEEEEIEEEEFEDDEEIETFLRTQLHNRKCGSLTSDGQETNSDIAFSDDLDSLSDQITSMTSLQHSAQRKPNPNLVEEFHHDGTEASSGEPGRDFALQFVRCDPRSLSQNEEDLHGLLKCPRSGLNSISEEERRASLCELEDDLNDDEEESVSAESGYSESTSSTNSNKEDEEKSTETSSRSIKSPQSIKKSSFKRPSSKRAAPAIP